VRNLVLYPDVALFRSDDAGVRRKQLWVVRDEISHFVRNDRVGLGSIKTAISTMPCSKA
jgi:hypothetical protein